MMKSRFRIASTLRRAVLAALLMLAIYGCGESNPLGRQALTGEVIFDGSRLASGLIEFAPNDPNGVSSGSSIQDGTYRIAAHQGVPPGRYTVRITSPASTEASEDEGQELGPPGPQAGGPRQPPPATERIPAAFNTHSSQVVTVTVEGPNRFDFDIPAAKAR